MYKTLNILFPHGKSAKNPHLENIWLGLTIFEGLGEFLYVIRFEEASNLPEDEQKRKV